MAITIREVSSEHELALWLDIRNEIEGGEPQLLRDVIARRAGDPGRVELIALLDGVPAGCALLGDALDGAETGCARANARTLPHLRRRGVGTALFEEVSRLARLRGRGELEIDVLADRDDALGFLSRRGFVERRRMIESVLTLPGRVPERGVDGVEIVTLTDDLLHGTMAVANEAEADVPGVELAELPFDAWCARELGSGFLAGVAAVAGGDVIGYATLGRDTPTSAVHWMTGVRRSWRRRGVATALKRAQIAWAGAAGLERLVAWNEAANVGMLTINRGLGYVEGSVALVLRGPAS